MRQIAFVILCLVLLSVIARTCTAQVATAALFGAWELDKQRSIEILKSEGEGAGIYGFDKLGLLFDFKKGGRLSVELHGAGGVLWHEGRWQVLSERGSELTAELHYCTDFLEHKNRLRFRFLDQNTVRVDDLRDRRTDFLMPIPLERRSVFRRSDLP